jgi:hypothetical protein
MVLYLLWELINFKYSRWKRNLKELVKYYD